MLSLLNKFQNWLDMTCRVDFLAPLALRLYLAPVFWMAGTNKLAHIDNTAAWFGNPDWGLGLPFPEVLAWLAALTEAGGAVLLVAGLAVRWIAIPLMFVMLIAIFAVHWDHGWQVIHDLQSPWAGQNAEAALDRLDRAKSILEEHGNYGWLTEHGRIVSLNNGIEWAATYFVMLLGLFFAGAGKYLSMDYWIAKKFRSQP